MGTRASVARGGVLLVVCVLVLTPVVPHPLFGSLAIITYAAACALIIRHAPDMSPFGAANGVTLLRLILTSLLAGFLAATSFAALPLSGSSAWLPMMLASVALALDGVDGAIARRRRQVSAFGAHFDMEVDAFLIAILSAMATALDKAGAWVLASGLLRYAFVLVGHVWPKIAAPLPPSFRRKTVMVVQAVALVIVVSPGVVPPVSAVVAALGLACLLYSFAVDTLWLLSKT